jgi:tripartite ATP-independent transporter DctM subunit
MVLYGVLASTSVSGLFIGGIIPGILMGLAMMAMCSYYAVKRNYPQHPRANLKQIWAATITTSPSLFTPVLIIGGIWFGFFTPTEASAVATAYAVVLTLLCYRELTWAGLYRVCRQTVLETGIILFILAAASMYGWLLIRYRIPFVLVDFMQEISTNPQVILLILNIFLLVVGCFMSVAAAITILTPLLVPMVIKVGIDPLHFGVVMVFNLMIGVLTPPYGSVLFVLVRVGEIRFGPLVRALAPWYIPLFITLGVISYFPSTVTWLPRLMGR